MKLPVMPPVSPMLAKLERRLPVGAGWRYEPKWDGFRAIVFRDGDEIEIASRNERPLGRYFPELLDPLRAALPERAVVDGEIVIATDHGLDFDLLSLRLHPAASRVQKLATETPASFVGFDVLAVGGDDVRERPFDERRAQLVALLGDATPPIHVTPITDDAGIAADWFERFEGAGLDGVIAKHGEEPYREGERVMRKVKHQRTADCAVAGWRAHAQSGVGSLLLGLYDDAGTLHHVGVASSFSADLRKTLARDIEAYRADALDGHPWREWANEAAAASGRMPGGPSRWNAGKDLSWEPLRLGLVAEVAYEHVQGAAGTGDAQGHRFRHTARFVRWRPDRDPSSCTYAQLEVPVPTELRDVFGV